MEKHTKQAIIICIIILLVLYAGVMIGMLLKTPEMPEEWQWINKGMPRSEVIKIIPDKVSDLRDVKGFDCYTRNYRILLLRPCWWQLSIHYDNKNNVNKIYANFIDPNCGLFNKNLVVVE